MTPPIFLAIVAVATLGLIGYWIAALLHEITVELRRANRLYASLVGNTDSIAAQTARIAGKPLT